MKKTAKTIPDLRFPEFDNEWNQLIFGDLYQFYTTNSLSRDKLNYDKGEIKNIHYGDIHTKFKTHFFLKNEYIPWINKDVDLSKIKESSFCKEGDLVMADASEDYHDIGKTIELIDLDNTKILAGLHTLLARPITENTKNGFVGHLLKSWKVRKQIMTIAQGTKVLGISTKRMVKIKINIPSISEQTKIANFLSLVDARITKLTKKKTLLEQYKKGIMQKIFSQQIRFKDENGNDFPEWETKTLGDITTSIRNGLSISQNLSKTGFKVTRIETISDGTINLNKVGYVDTDQNIDNYKLKIGNVLFSNINSVVHIGKVAYVNQDHNLYHGMNLLNISFNEVSNLPLFMFYQLKSKKLKVYFERICNKAVNQASINQTDLKKTKLQVPPLSEQTKITHFLTAIDKKINFVNQQIEENNTYKKGLLQKMFI